MQKHNIVSRSEWLAHRKELLAQEKQLTRMRDELAAKRRALPWVRVEKSYVFDTPNGTQSLADLFVGRSQLAIYHLMFAPDWDGACKSCSFWADSFNGIIPHLHQRDVSFAAISRAPLEKLQAFQKRLGWTFPWFSSFANEFNRDFGVTFTADELATGEIQYNYGRHSAHRSEMPGISVFYRDGAEVFHTYSCYSRGIDAMNAAYQYLDLVPKGRDETGYPMSWVNYRDQYDAR